MPKDPKWQQRAPRYQREAGPSPTGKKGYYIWRVPQAYASRTRKDHLRLDGQVCSWENPPVVNTRTGERGHPGMDAHCRCYAEPVDPNAQGKEPPGDE